MRGLGGKVAVAGVGAALALCFLAGVAYLPTLSLAMACAAGLCVCLPLLFRQKLGAVLSYLSAAALAFLLFGLRVDFLPFTVFFAPFCFVCIVLASHKTAKYLCEFALVNLAIAGVYFLAAVLTDGARIAEFLRQWWWLVVLAGNAVVVPFDWALSQTYRHLQRLVQNRWEK